MKIKQAESRLPRWGDAFGSMSHNQFGATRLTANSARYHPAAVIDLEGLIENSCECDMTVKEYCDCSLGGD